MKLNYKTSYTHATKATETGENLNDIILQKRSCRLPDRSFLRHF
ncbi:MAG: hypothetical protein ACLURV_06840 [Gallintestinimicrobium sp.]